PQRWRDGVPLVAASAERARGDDAHYCPNRFHRSSMLAVHAQLAAFFDAKRQASVLPYVSSNRARQTRLEGAGGVERPTLRVIPHGGRESVSGGGTHPRATELTTSERLIQ